MEISGHSLEESMEECRVEEMSVHKVRSRISPININLASSRHGMPTVIVLLLAGHDDDNVVLLFPSTVPLQGRLAG